MKNIVLFLIGMACISGLQAQIRIKPQPQPGFDKRIATYVSEMKVVDTHEHLEGQTSWMKNGKLDFMLLLQHYAYDDIRSAGMAKQTFNKLLTDSLSVIEKWNTLKPFWEGTSNTAYCRAALLTADQLFGIQDINGQTVESLSAKIKKAYQTDWYKVVINEKCAIDYMVIDGADHTLGSPSQFKYVKKFDYLSIDSRKKIGIIAKRQNVALNSVDDLVGALETEFKEAVKQGCVAIKTTVAYNRTLLFEDVSKTRAEEVFEQILSSKSDAPLPIEDVKPLQDYMMHRILDLARATNTPVQIHTGLQAGDGNYIENSRPTHLANLLLKYRDVNFILFHGGYPYGGELATLAKNFRNVSIDMCWLYIISPSYSERYLNEWLETVPANKIMAFGGDFRNVENIFGHLLFAKQIISKVLIDKVRDGYFTENEAIKIAQMILHDNAIRILKLDKR